MVTLRMMWQYKGRWDIQTKKPPQVLDFEDVTTFEELFETAPEPGSPIE
jgi:hypothetical protein